MYVIKNRANKGVCCVVLSPLILVNYSVPVKVHSISTVNYKIIISLFVLTVFMKLCNSTLGRL